jgi:hypothetical protein
MPCRLACTKATSHTSFITWPPLRRMSATLPPGHPRTDKAAQAHVRFKLPSPTASSDLGAVMSFAHVHMSVCPSIVWPLTCVAIRNPHSVTYPPPSPARLLPCKIATAISSFPALPLLWTNPITASLSTCAGRGAPPYLRVPLETIGAPSPTSEHRCAIAVLPPAPPLW